MKIEFLLFFAFSFIFLLCLFGQLFLILNELSERVCLMLGMQSIAVLPTTCCRFGGVSQTKPTGGRSQRFVLAGRQTHRRTVEQAGRQTDTPTDRPTD